MKFNSFKEYLEKVMYLKDKVVLPNGQTIYKDKYIKEDGFDSAELQNDIFKIYNYEYPVKPNSLRYKISKYKLGSNE